MAPGHGGYGGHGHAPAHTIFDEQHGIPGSNRLDATPHAVEQTRKKSAILMEQQPDKFLLLHQLHKASPSPPPNSTEEAPVPPAMPAPPLLADSERAQPSTPSKSKRRSADSPHEKKVFVQDAPTIIVNFLDKVGEKINAPTLRIWFQHLDVNQNMRIDWDEFRKGMGNLGYEAGNLRGLWAELDTDGVGEVTFDQFDPEEAALWNTFRRWSGSMFRNAKDMLRQLKFACREAGGHVGESDVYIVEEEFVQGMRSIGWPNGLETVLYRAMDVEGEGQLAARDLKWLEVEARRYRQKEAAKRWSMRVAEKKANKKQVRRANLLDFKAFLRQSFGPLFRAWRRALDPDGSMLLSRAELFKVCRQMNWKGDVRALWTALDHDNSGVTSLDELDPHCAQLLAQFQEWAKLNWGPRPVVEMFRALDRQRTRMIKHPQFVEECKAHGFSRKVKTLAMWLDWEDKRYLTEDDFRFLDNWHPPAWLVAVPNPVAAEDFKAHILAKYGHYLKGWRIAMDRDSSNNCNWHEFTDAAKLIKFNGDVAGSWLALDEDLSGFISLKEIDSTSHNALLEFKRWADDEFGGVRSAFKALDTDCSNELTYREFRAACHNFGFEGDLRTLFESLDQDGQMMLNYKEVIFLDDWDNLEPDRVLVGGEAEAEELPAALPQEASQNQIDYRTLSPGPGAYDVVSGFGATPHMPTARHGGAFTFTLRKPLLTLKGSKTVGPSSYNPSLKATAERKPAWSFATAGMRHTPRSQTPRGGSSRMMSPRSDLTSPGPGAYDVKPMFTGPKFSMRPRRGVTVHPEARPSSRSM
eukprot:gnl/TRDRNA2_/TRDRNA2_195024_c0_seq1.p1 gnl/TRDRNA2_/TRDRNA2_195024_c0~~gnl/TRDRNA2_/TRDRNA2_195024_c0_seq1.p1  ORF type:complete len:840 (+),score=161.68 gnl/TRDRNA2_/TRDRNA2_195024_c0_seq1:101-2521(+)